jgi:hypothetical protein
VAAAVTVSATASRSGYADASYFQVDRHSIPCGDVDWTGRRQVPVLRVAYSPDLGRIAVDPEVRSITDAAVSVLERDLGAEVEQPDFQLPYCEGNFGAVIAADTDLTGLRPLAERYGDTMSPRLQGERTQGPAWYATPTVARAVELGPTPDGCTSRWASGCVTARRSSRRGCRRQRGGSNADVQTSGGRSPLRLDVHSTHGSHMRSEGVPVPGCSCPVPVRRVRDGRRSDERAGDPLSRVARPRLAIPGNSRYFPDHSAPAGGPSSAPPFPASVTARRRSSP